VPLFGAPPGGGVPGVEVEGVVPETSFERSLSAPLASYACTTKKYRVESASPLTGALVTSPTSIFPV
jgi:hypothetical protein